MYVKSALGGSTFYIDRGDGFSDRRIYEIRLENRLISRCEPADFGHTGEKALRIRGALMARVVRHCGSPPSDDANDFAAVKGPELDDIGSGAPADAPGLASVYRPRHILQLSAILIP